MNENAALLRTLMQDASLTRAETANLLHVSAPTIASWLRPTNQKAHRPTPDWAVDLLKRKTAHRRRA